MKFRCQGQRYESNINSPSSKAESPAATATAAELGTADGPIYSAALASRIFMEISRKTTSSTEVTDVRPLGQGGISA